MKTVTHSGVVSKNLKFFRNITLSSIQFNSNLCLFTRRLNSLKANYKIGTGTRKHTHTQWKKNKTRQNCAIKQSYSHPPKLHRRWFWDRWLIVAQAGFHTNAMLKWTRWLWTIYFGQDKKYIRVYKEIKKRMKWQRNDNLRRRQFLLNCKQVICRWRRRAKWRWLEKKTLTSIETQSSLSLAGYPHSNDVSKKLLFSCCWSLV